MKTDSPASPKPSTEGLLRGIRKWDLIAVAINAIIGAGIFGLPARVFALIGSYSLISFVFCALGVTLIIFCFSPIGSRFYATRGACPFVRATALPTLRIAG